MPRWHTPDDGDLVFCLTADAGPFEPRALLLVRSIASHHPDASILTYVPADGLDAMHEDAISELRTLSTLETGPLPIEGYPVSAFAESMRRGADRFAGRYIVGVDTDAVLLNSLTLPETAADLFATRAHIGARRQWAADAPSDDWHDLFDSLDLPAPTTTEPAIADGYPTWPPIYNAGVVVTTDRSLPERLLTLSREIHDGPLFPDSKYYAETYALAVLAADPNVSFQPLELRHNHMMGGYPTVPDATEILHYQFFDTFSTLRNEKHKQTLESLGVRFSPRPSDYAIRALSLLVFRAGRVLPYWAAHRGADLVQPIFDWNNPDQ